MAWSPPRHWSEALLFFLQAVPFGFALSSGTRIAWIAAFSLGAAINLWGWLIAFGKRRRILDTPTSRVASAAQGYVELIGTGQPLADTCLLAPYSQLPCLWYHYTVERRQNDEWRQVESGASDLPFNLDDGSGVCELDPRGAEILTTHQETRGEGDFRTHESLLLKGDRLYALGGFTSVNGAQADLDRHRDIGVLLGEWKQNQPSLKQRFDLDGNGAIDDREWQLARLAAEREVMRQHQERRARPLSHTLHRHESGLPYLISNHPQERLRRRYGWLAALHLLLLLAMLTGLGWAWGR